MNKINYQKPNNQLLTFNETFDSSLHDNCDERFTIDKKLLPAIKENNASKVVDDSPEAELDANTGLYDPAKEVAKEVIGIRKRYDRIKTQANCKNHRLEKASKEKSILTKQVHILKQASNKQKQSLMEVQQQLERSITDVEEIIYKKEVYGNIMERLKKDNLYYKKRCFDYNTSIIRGSIKLKSLEGQSDGNITLEKKCRGLLSTVSTRLVTKEHERERKLDLYTTTLDQKRTMRNIQEERETKIGNVMASGVMERFPEEKEQVKLLRVHQFLRKMLRTKMEREMEKNMHFETAYTKIKQETDIKNIGEFIDRFLSKQKIYGELLDSISAAEATLLRHKNDHEELERKNVTLLEEEADISELRNDDKDWDQSQEHKNLGKLNAELQGIEKKKVLIHSWGVKFISLFQGEVTREHYTNKYPREKVKQLLIDNLKVTSLYLDSLAQEGTQKEGQNPQDLSKVKSQVARRSGEDEVWREMQNRNLRIKTEPESMKTNDETIEDHDVAYQDLAEQDFFDRHVRQVLKKDKKRKVKA